MSEENKLQVKKELPVKGLFKSFGLPRLIAVFFWFAGMDLMILRRSETDAVTMWQDFVNGVPVVTLIARTLAGFALLTLIRFLLKNSKNPEISDSVALFTGSVFFACTALYKSTNFYFILGVLAVTLVFAGYAAGREDLQAFDKFPFPAALVIIALISAAMLAFLTVISVCIHKTFNTSCFDLGIFAQMFHSMKQDLSMNTTCERNFLLSHAEIHSSYILYVLLPFYALFPNVYTLMIAQALLVVSGVIPTVLIARKHGFKGLFTVFACFMYVFNAGIMLPCLFHFHENCFLPPLLMWLIYAVDSRKFLPVYILSVLTCLVKEDATVFVVCIGLFLLADEKGKKRWHGAVMAVLAMAYLVIMMKRLAVSGSTEMMMEQRFSNLVFGDNQGLTGVVMNVLRNPSYLFSLIFSEKSLVFFLQIMLPLLFLPFMTTKIHRYLLMLPFVITNLVIGSGYHYAAEIGFHYTFGTASLLIFVSIVNCSELKEETCRKLISVAAASALITSMAIMTGRSLHYYENYVLNKENYQKIEACLASIPQDAIVMSDTKYLPHIAARKEIYMLSEDDIVIANGKVVMIKDINKYDFFVLNTQDGNTEDMVTLLKASGFTLFAESGGRILIYRK